MGLFSFVGGLIGAGAAKKATKKAEAARIAAMEKGIAEQGRQFDLSRSDFMPFMQAGTGALGGMSDLVGLNGEDEQQTALDALKASPLYQSLFNTGEEAILQNAAATGGIRGGNTIRGLADFGADTFAKLIQQQLGNLSGIAGMGLGATGSIAGIGAGKANAVTDLLTGQGEARANGLLTRGGITAGMWNNAGAFLDSAVKAALGAGAGPGGASFNLGSFLQGGGGLQNDVRGMMLANPGVF